MTRDFSCFYKKGGGREGFRAICKICNAGQNKNARSLQDKTKVSEYNKAYKKNNLDRIKEVDKNYRSRVRSLPEVKRARLHYEHLRRINQEKQIGVVPVDYWEILISVFGNRCLECGSDDQLTLDHVIPLSKGGMHCISNFQILCHLCNARKGNRNMNDYRPFKYTLLVG